MARTFTDDNSSGFFEFFFAEKSSKHLKIPPAFVRRFVQELQERVTLEDHCGRCWDVGMVIVGHHLCLGTGWEDFVREHCFRNGDLLMFKRLGTSRFGVKIFCQNVCKKEAEAIPETLGGVKANEEDEGEGDRDEEGEGEEEDEEDEGEGDRDEEGEGEEEEDEGEGDRDEGEEEEEEEEEEGDRDEEGEGEEEEDQSAHRGPSHAYKATWDERKRLNGSTEKPEIARNKSPGIEQDSADQIAKIKASNGGKTKGVSMAGTTMLKETPTATMKKPEFMSPEEMLARVSRMSPRKLATLTAKRKARMEEIGLKKGVEATPMSRAPLSPSPSNRSGQMQLKKKQRLEGGGVGLGLSNSLSLQDDFNVAFQVGSSLLTHADEEILLSKPISTVAESFAAHSALAMQEGLALGCFYVRLEGLCKTLELERDSLQTHLEEQKSEFEKKESELMTLLREAKQLHVIEMEKNERLRKEVAELQEEAKDNYAMGWMKARCELLREYMEGKHASWDAAAQVARYEALLVDSLETTGEVDQEEAIAKPSRHATLRTTRIKTGHS